jgi:hypothetical protein
MKITTSTASFEPGPFKPLPIVNMVFRRPVSGGVLEEITFSDGDPAIIQVLMDASGWIAV